MNKWNGLHMHTPPNLAMRLDGETSSLTICRTCMVTGIQPEVPNGSGSPFSPSHPQQPHPSLVPPQESSPRPHHDPWLQGILNVASRIVFAGAGWWRRSNSSLSFKSSLVFISCSSTWFQSMLVNSPTLKYPQTIHSALSSKSSPDKLRHLLWMLPLLHMKQPINLNSTNWQLVKVRKTVRWQRWFTAKRMY